jgi:hypothetical protein
VNLKSWKCEKLRRAAIGRGEVGVLVGQHELEHGVEVGHEQGAVLEGKKVFRSDFVLVDQKIKNILSEVFKSVETFNYLYQNKNMLMLLK